MNYTRKPARLLASAVTLLAICETRGNVELAPLSGTVVKIGNFTITVPDQKPASNLPESLPVRIRSSGKGADETTVTVRAEGNTRASSVFVLSGRPAARSRGLDTDDLTASESLPNAFTLSGEVGIASGYGGSAGWRFGGHLGLRAGLDAFTYSKAQTLSDISYKLNLKLQTEPVLLDLYPWKNRSFRLSVGVRFNQNEFKASASPTAPIELGNVTYAAGDVGTLNLRVKQNPVSPYASLGGNMFYFDSAHQWAFSGELGAYYAGKPKVELSSTNSAAAAGVERERQQVVESLGSHLNIIPVIKLGVGYSF